MVLIKSIENQFVEFSITGYQYPPDAESDPLKNLRGDEKNDDDDDDVFDDGDDWLMITLKVKSKKAEWSCTDPALTVEEVKELIEWLTILSLGRNPVNRDMSFLEPNLCFGLLEDYNNRKKIRIHFDMECVPKCLREDGNDTEEYFLDCYFTNEELATLAISLFKELETIR